MSISAAIFIARYKAASQPLRVFTLLLFHELQFQEDATVNDVCSREAYFR